MFEIILTALIIIVGELLVFVCYEKHIDTKYQSGRETQKPSPPGDSEFWKNIISYQTKKKGDEND